MEINFKNQTGYITLKSGHSMFTGNKPKIITNEMFTEILPKFSEDAQDTFEQFGLFETAAPNYTTYYPDVTADDLNPKDEDFIYPMFRCLSATIVWKGYKPIDFSKPGVLKASMGLLVGQTINVDHEVATGNAIGVVRSTVWQEGYTAKGTKIPAGINGEFMIDGKSNPRLARGINSSPPIIHSNSVGVRFKWEPSHKMKDNEDFYSKLGTKDDKGNLYRLIVVEILGYNETSLVSHGADPYAQVMKDGVINNPTHAAGVYNFSSKGSDENHPIEHPHFIDYKTDLKEIGLQLSFDTIPVELNNNHKDNKKEESMDPLELLEVAFGIDKGTLTKENLSAELGKFVDTKVESLTSDIQGKLDAEKLITKQLGVDKTQLEADKVLLTSEKATLQGQADLGVKYSEVLTAKREEAKKHYNLVKGDDAKAEMLTHLESCDEAALDLLAADYKSQVELKFPDTCKGCGSHDINKASFVEDNESGNQGNETLTGTALREKLKKDTRKKNVKTQ